jgi:hypothetical protein
MVKKSPVFRVDPLLSMAVYVQLKFDPLTTGPEFKLMLRSALARLTIAKTSTNGTATLLMRTSHKPDNLSKVKKIRGSRTQPASNLDNSRFGRRARLQPGSFATKLPPLA